ncbi:EAL domain-containing protein [Bacillaceae bacterium S4-13-56]
MKKLGKKELLSAPGIGAIYFGIAIIWVVLSDMFMYSILEDSQLASVLKGASFVILTSFLLYYLIRKQNHEKIEQEKRLWNSENKYQTVFQHSSSGMLLVHPETYSIIDCNETFSRWTDFTKKELNECTVQDILQEGSPEVPEGDTSEWHLISRTQELLHVVVRQKTLSYDNETLLLYNMINLTPIMKQNQKLKEISMERNRFIHALDSVRQGIILCDHDGSEYIIRYANKGLDQLLGTSSALMFDQPLFSILENYSDLPSLKQIQDALLQKVSTTVEHEIHSDHGKHFWNELTIEPVFNQKNKVENFVLFFSDISDRKITDQVLNTHNQLLKGMFTNRNVNDILTGIIVLVEQLIPQSMASVTMFPKGHQEYIAPTLRMKLKKSYEPFLRQMFQAVWTTDNQEDIFLVERVESSLHLQGVSPLLEVQGIRQVILAPIEGKDGQWVALIHLFLTRDKPLTDIEKRSLTENIHLARIAILSKEAEDIIYHQTNYDDLTGLPNRKHLLRLMANCFNSCDDDDTQCAVYFIDVDRFKQINDTFGHSAGNEMLIEVSNRLKEQAGSPTILSRLGGDEFAIVVKPLDPSPNWQEIGDYFLQALQSPFSIGEHQIKMTGSAGYAIYPNDGKTPEELLRNSDIAMFMAKEKGKNQVEAYNETLRLQTKRLLLMENNLKKAIENNEFILHYQPQFDLSSGALTGFEALVRWMHPIFGIIPPSEFIPIAEKNGLIVPMGRWIIREACEQAKKWQLQGYPPVMMGINISLKQFMQKDFVQMVFDILEQTRLDPHFLTIEITESVAMHRPNVTIDAMNQLRKKGVGISIDDFGTGFSSLSHLKDLPVSMLKIDRSFVNDITKEKSKAYAITQSTIQLAHNLNLNIVAEGIETADQLKILKRYFCQTGQGFFFSRPLPAEQAVEFFHQQVKV